MMLSLFWRIEVCPLAGSQGSVVHWTVPSLGDSRCRPADAVQSRGLQLSLAQSEFRAAGTHRWSTVPPGLKGLRSERPIQVLIRIRSRHHAMIVAGTT